METVIGLCGRDFALVACDRYANSSILRMKDDEDKLLTLDHDKVMGLAGAIGDRNQFGEYIQKNIHLYRFRTSRALSCEAAANFTRQQLAQFLRRSPYQVDCMVAGYDQKGPQLFWIDYLASMVPVKKGAHGYAAYFLGGLLDRFYHPEITEEEALEVVRRCKKELSTRFIAAQTAFRVKVATKDGIRTVDI